MFTTKLLLKSGHVVDVKNDVDTICDILLDNGKIACVGENIIERDAQIIDCTGLVIFPGLFDMHVHLRDPGQTYKEDILTGCEAAAAGGITGVLAMPNTNPVCDSAETVHYILDKAKNAKAKVFQVGAITKGLEGNEYSDFAELKAAGCIAVSDDGRPVKNALMMKNAIRMAAENGMTLTSHCEDLDIIDGGKLNDGKISSELGVKGMPRSSENYITAREILLAEELDLPVHIAHVSTKEAVEIIRTAKRCGVKVTCETAPHYFSLTEEKLLTRDADYRMNPPLRTSEDVEAIIGGILDGTIDCIVTDHAPHSAEDKKDFIKAPNGVVGMETSLSVTYTKLVKSGKISLKKLVKLMSVNPRKILKLSGGSLEKGAVADITVFDPDEEWTVVPEKLHSKSKNTCFKGETLFGRVKYTILNGNVVYKD